MNKHYVKKKDISKLLRVFVYGTLKVGGRLSGPFNSSRVSVKKGTTRGSMYNVNGNYPAVLIDTDDTVHGEVHEYDNPDKTRNHMDMIEGFCGVKDPANLYDRREVEVKVGDELIICEIYEFNRSVNNYKKINNGVWEI